MGKKSKAVTWPPTIFNVFKPARMTSYDVIRHFKRNLPDGYGKIGHFGTLDPFASGVLLIGVAGAARLNDYIHEHAPKTYLAIGKLGVETPTGDLTVSPSQVDESLYLTCEISKFSTDFIEKQLQEKFIGDYWQAPHKYSAAKFEGKTLHEWAREGVEIKKEKKLRHIHSLEVVKYQFPYLSIRVTVSSGTYVRTLFSDCANYLGTIGTLVSLVREKIGHANLKNCLKKSMWPDKTLKLDWNYNEYSISPWKLLDYPTTTLTPKNAKLFLNGVQLRSDQFESINSGLQWISDGDSILGLACHENNLLKVKINFKTT